MERRLILSLLVTIIATVGCNSSLSTDPSGSATAPNGATPTAASVTYADPAAQAAHEFLDAVVKGETARASALLTPLAIEQIAASGKPFQLPGLANYTFRVGQVRRPAPDKAFVQCTGTDRSKTEGAVEEDFCWLMSEVDQQWRIAGISYTAGTERTLMVYSFENPEKGAIPVQQLMAQSAGQTAAANSQQPAQTPPLATPVETPRTAHEAIPAGAYR